MYRVKIDITLKRSVLDPQGKTVKAALHSMGFNNVSDVRVGKYCEITLDASSANEAKKEVNDVCNKLLVNPVIEEYSFTIDEV